MSSGLVQAQWLQGNTISQDGTINEFGASDSAYNATFKWIDDDWPVAENFSGWSVNHWD